MEDSNRGDGNLRPLIQYSPEEWLKLTQAQQMERYNDCVHNIRVLVKHLSTVMAQVKAVRSRLEARNPKEMKGG